MEPISLAVVVDMRQVLLVRRCQTEGTLQWAFPGGVIEDGETADRAAVRETREETGLVVRAVHTLGARVHPLTHRQVTYVACATVEGRAHVAAPREISDVAWVGLPEIPRYVPRGLWQPVQAHLAQVLA
ncbi:NUDIX hydrolase [Streptomyces sp. HNM0575]|uniref:NUDIX hydrolase n=1 Tax=Streptomyces sp. HNM0575 TaxID=2716338 RepID=UPI00145DBB9C|nr:NUDIX hydrolase [Streptomyces sp. HNM0575]NLU76155.1 NUDIX hydrolase [Streptomyces sp. HNM0575]